MFSQLLSFERRIFVITVWPGLFSAVTDRNKDGKPELDFEVDEEDIRLPEIRSEEMEGKGKRRYFGPHRTDHIVPEMDYSLRVSEGEMKLRAIENNWHEEMRQVNRHKSKKKKK